MTLQEFVIRIGAVIMLGPVIGLERQWRLWISGPLRFKELLRE